jgi:hypothetical protein
MTFFYVILQAGLNYIQVYQGQTRAKPVTELEIRSQSK